MDALFIHNSIEPQCAMTGLYQRRNINQPKNNGMANMPGIDHSLRQLGLSIQSHVATLLPPYMTPTTVIILNQLPLTPNGKLDTQALPEPKLISRNIRSPRSDNEKRIAQLFADSLGLEQIGLDDRFFDLGGDSILSIQLVNRGREQGLIFSVQDVFSLQCVESLAAKAVSVDNAFPLKTSAFLPELSVWQDILQTPDPLLYRGENINDPEKGLLILSNDLPNDIILRVLREIPKIFHVSAEQTLLFAASLAYEDVEQPTAIVIDIENTQDFWQTYDLSNLTDEAADTRIIEIMAKDTEQRFNLSEPPLIRFALIRRSAKRHHLLVTDHHIILDGWSMSTLWEELFTLYRDNRIQLPKPTTYKDYLTWLSQKHHEEAIRVWRSYLSGVDGPTLIAPGREAHHIIPQTTGVFVPEQLKQALMRTVLKLGLTLNSLMQTAWGMLLCHLTGRYDVLFGITVSERPADIPRSETTVGLMINTVPLRVTLDPEESLESLLTRIQNNIFDVLPYRYLGLTEIQRAIGMGELFDSYYVFQNYPNTTQILSGSSKLQISERINGSFGVSHYPLGITVIPNDKIELLIGYDPNFFDIVSINKIKENLLEILSQLGKE